MKTVHIVISGKVQGVFFRASAKDIARLYNISGWIKNASDNKVEALITGTGVDVLKFIEWCKHGPVKAEVEYVTVTNKELQTFRSFEVIR